MVKAIDLRQIIRLYYYSQEDFDSLKALFLFFDPRRVVLAAPVRHKKVWGDAYLFYDSRTYAVLYSQRSDDNIGIVPFVLFFVPDKNNTEK